MRPVFGNGLENRIPRIVLKRINLIIDEKPVTVSPGATVLEAARQADIYVPALCAHPDLPPSLSCAPSHHIFQEDLEILNTDPGNQTYQCGLCLVAIQGGFGLSESCAVEATEGMIVETDNEQIRDVRKENLMKIMSRHPHACLICSQQEGCTRTECAANVPENERCCDRFGHCELQNVAGYIGVADSTPRWVPTLLPISDSDPLLKRDYNLCIGCTRCVRACRDLRGIDALGFVFDINGQCRVGCVAPGLKESGCRFCTACVAVCPTGALMDKGVEPGTLEADLVPCRAACPVHMDVPGYLRMIALGETDAAGAIIRERVPFPEILGRVCTHPCETVCRRGEVNEPIAICALKRYAAGKAAGQLKDAPRSDEDTGKQVAVIGAGPAGLTAAFYLRQKGHQVVMFEAQAEAGGMMRYGIPRYRLPIEILEKEIADILELGVDLRADTRLGVDMTLDQFRGDGFDAVFLAIGAQKSRGFQIDGCDLPEAVWGIDFLKKMARGDPIQLKGSVLVIGGGNTAVDVAMTAMRCGAVSVSMACLETEAGMPASSRDIECALAEGVKLLPSCGMERVMRENGRITGADLVESTCVFDDEGNFRIEFGSKKVHIRVDHLIVAVGQKIDLSFSNGDTPGFTKDGFIVIDGQNMKTKIPDVFAGGEATGMPEGIVDAVAAGRMGASAIDVALGGDGDIHETLLPRTTSNPVLGRDEHFATKPRVKTPEREPVSRLKDFDEIMLGYSTGQACREAARCLQCDLRLDIGCNPAPPEQMTVFDWTYVASVPEIAGVYRLFNEERDVVAIQGTPNLRQSLIAELSERRNIGWFDIEIEPLYSKRESRLLQKHLQQHGHMPGEGDDDDLF